MIGKDGMTLLRFFVPKGGGRNDARLQYQETFDLWMDVPLVYEDPGDEIIPCPRLEEGLSGHSLSVGGDIHARMTVCSICLGEGQGRRGDIERRMGKTDEYAMVIVGKDDGQEES